MYDVAVLWLGGVNTVVYLTIVIVVIITVQWIMTQLRGSREQAIDAQNKESKL